jgi:hypothetical protein
MHIAALQRSNFAFFHLLRCMERQMNGRQSWEFGISDGDTETTADRTRNGFKEDCDDLIAFPNTALVTFWTDADSGHDGIAG